MVNRLAVVLTTALVIALGSGCTAFKRWAYGEGASRDAWQHPEQVIQALAIRPGQRVADLGAGGGYFTFRLADAVGSTGIVYAVDIDPGMIAYLQRRAAEDGYRNVDVILAAPDDPRLPQDGVDLIFTCDTYHHLEDRTAYFARLKQYLRPGGRVAIIDHSGSHGLFVKLFGHFTPTSLMRSELEAAGYKLQHEYDFLPRQSFLVFSRGEG
jgi:arsenite methyltransferase